MEKVSDDLFALVKGLSAFTKGNIVQADFRGEGAVGGLVAEPWAFWS